ncbi:uncharacterized protein LOC126892009 [Diabrotica virgifera virgifera]|uniref:Phospholipase A2-like domain-containing protein n=2 Tax=Diabrotica virgifera virgifera TaxID=50390 RepID=A0ABM5KRF0_DIAVI|nr:uncharacterized protein LOC126884987 [Diabrotica virgifera virgifera]XP_050508222.1 uncharacterized protein LOC126885632 [Diabrotica virgifera virgifera]XP_050509272.1 uncharacterized protein LOC126886393 [Diabrotica virgifera virgifera]XP_050510165.1 uncharacterized protein LOC126886980 [Diabrotica virgifera virgifera]XP_050510235.1 uncharacterized protein LOC126886999 [Diabrotica virgifera virgifera]XP_050512401.1 uncharacterized protein LOC126888311 [Diabrotica virgifera virgifera]XP_05
MTISPMLVFKGEGLLNSLINKLPVELHIPGYQYCGPGTKLKKRLARGDPGINPLDAACKQHDIAYSHHTSLEERHKADKELEDRAWERFKSKDASFGEKSAALLVTGGMKTKRKLGMGCPRRRGRKGRYSFNRDVVPKIAKSMKRGASLRDTALTAVRIAKSVIKKLGGRKTVDLPRVLPLKSGGFLPLIPLFAGLSALGALAGGAAGVAKTVVDAKNAQKKLEEDMRHNKAMEHIGSGLYLRKKPRGGFGLYLKKNFQ